ncbi:hypothetical protein NBRC116593_29010 [Sulfitobacter pacificus]
MVAVWQAETVEQAVIMVFFSLLKGVPLQRGGLPVFEWPITAEKPVENTDTMIGGVFCDRCR